MQGNLRYILDCLRRGSVKITSSVFQLDDPYPGKRSPITRLVFSCRPHESQRASEIRHARRSAGCDDGAPTGRGRPPALQRAVLRDDKVEVVVAEALAVLRGDHPPSILRAASQRHVVDAEQSGQVVR